MLREIQEIQLTESEIEDLKKYGALHTIELKLTKGKVSYEVDKDFIRDLKLHYSGANGTNFRAQLIRLIGKADPSNRQKLATGYPEEVLTVWLCMNNQGFYDRVVGR